MAPRSSAIVASRALSVAVSRFSEHPTAAGLRCRPSCCFCAALLPLPFAGALSLPCRDAYRGAARLRPLAMWLLPLRAVASSSCCCRTAAAAAAATSFRRLSITTAVMGFTSMAGTVNVILCAPGEGPCKGVPWIQRCAG